MRRLGGLLLLRQPFFSRTLEMKGGWSGCSLNSIRPADSNRGGAVRKCWVTPRGCPRAPSAADYAGSSLSLLPPCRQYPPPRPRSVSRWRPRVISLRALQGRPAPGPVSPHRTAALRRAATREPSALHQGYRACTAERGPLRPAQSRRVGRVGDCARLHRYAPESGVQACGRR